jgi:hypothetical protein
VSGSRSFAAAGPRPPAAAVVLGIAVASGLVGLAAAGGSDSFTLLVSAVIALAAWAALFFHPRLALALVIPQVAFFPVLPIFGGHRGLNPIDIFLPSAVIGAWLFVPRRVATGAPSLALERARDRLARAMCIYLGLAVVSLIGCALAGNPGGALDSMLLLSRDFEAVFLFWAMDRLLDGEADVRRSALLLGGGLMFALVLNLSTMVLFHLPRAGAIWVYGEPSGNVVSWNVGPGRWVATNPNELAMGCLMACALFLAVPLGKWRGRVLFTGTVVLLLATLSRSGLLSFLILVVLHTVQRRRWRLWLIPLVLLLAFPVLPSDIRLRILRTLTMAHGSFEVYTSVIRVYSWITAFKVFLAHPFLGVGYIGFRFVSQHFNNFGFALGTAENFYLETASGMGVIGLAAVAWVVVSLVRLLRLVRRLAPPGTTAYRLAGIGPAFLVGAAVSNWTADYLIGMLGILQMCVFFALLVVSAREALRNADGAGVPGVPGAPGAADTGS